MTETPPPPPDDDRLKDEDTGEKAEEFNYHDTHDPRWLLFREQGQGASLHQGVGIREAPALRRW